MAAHKSSTRARNFKDLTGQTFGRLTVIRFDENPEDGKLSYWICRCECGEERRIVRSSLVQGLTRSCGCLHREKAKHLGQSNTKHGETGSPEYISWKSMLDRCYYAKHKSYSRYGGRGITVCERWRTSFSAFLDDMGPKPTPTHTVDRHPNQDGNYESGNCRWATPVEQARNRKNNFLIEYQGETKTACEWAEKLNMSVVTLKARLKYGWTVEAALATPVDHRKASCRKKGV